MEWGQVLAGLIGVIVGVVSKAGVDLWTEGRRHRHERQMRLLDTALKTAVEFLAAAERTSRASPSVEVESLSVDNARKQGQEIYEQHLRRLEDAQERFYSAYVDAENGYAGLRMVIPAVAQPARKYLDLCRDRDRRDLRKADRDELKEDVERTIRDALGIGPASTSGRPTSLTTSSEPRKRVGRVRN